LIPVVTADEMRRIDRKTIRDHVPGIELMESAGTGVKDEILRSIKPRRSAKIVIVCGKGNNGGDGYVISRLLKRDGYNVKTFLIGRAKDVKGDAEANLKRCRRDRIRIKEVGGENLGQLEEGLSGAHVVVDALFGTGFKGKPEGLSADVIDLMSGAAGYKVAVDIPSGVDASTGGVVIAARADLTVTMGLPKRGHLLFPGRALTGDLVVTDIGIPPEVVSDARLDTFLLEKADIRAGLPERPPEAHKWSCGHVAAICGSTGFTGAATLTSISALRSGCGLVTLAVPRSLSTVMEIKLTEVMTRPVEETAEGSFSLKASSALEALVKKADCVALGPGLSQSQETLRLVRRIVPRLGRPCVLDADGINAFAGSASKLKSLGFPLIITPHAGEAARLFAIDKKQISDRRIDFPREMASDLGAFFVLKGAPTIIAGPEGLSYINPTGNQGLATAGSGDVLTGAIAGLVAQGVPPLKAACCAVYIHGVCGDMLLTERGYYGYLAGELADAIPGAMASITSDDL
jgi:hydroxyethylthiazole kinase-like uncharacterized protein yjeF